MILGTIPGLKAPMLQDVLHHKVPEGMATELWCPGKDLRPAEITGAFVT